jgi:hypothetical protein
MIPPADGEGSATRSALRLVGLVGFLVSASILTGTWVGIKLDQTLQTQGIVTALGILLGLFIGLGLAGWLLLRETQYRRRP